MPCDHEMGRLPTADTSCQTMHGFGAMQGRLVSLCTMHSYRQQKRCLQPATMSRWQLRCLDATGNVSGQALHHRSGRLLYAAVYPDLSSREMVVPEDLINKGIGVQLETAQMADLLSRMQLQAEAVPGSQVRVLVPPTRSDVLHACDVMEVRPDPYALNFSCQDVPCHGFESAATIIMPYQLGADHATSKHGLQAITSCFSPCSTSLGCLPYR